VIERLYRAFGALLHGVAVAGVASLVLVIAVVVADIAWRRLTAQAMIGTVDLTQLCVMFAAFAAIPYTFLRKGHVGLEVLTDPLPRRVWLVLDGIAALIGCATVGVLTWLAWCQARQHIAYGDVSQDLGIPMIWYWGPLLAGGVLSCLATLLIAARAFTAAAGHR
jgi:TRAP-type C4-dicarboxylate transport system permease small subunit